MFSVTLLNSLMLCFFIIILCSLTTTAPTHHLSIGVQGNTPTLIVTSSEIGITPEIETENKISSKTELNTKSSKETGYKSSEKYKISKTKTNKNLSLLNKKEKKTKQNLLNNKKSSLSDDTFKQNEKPSIFLSKDAMTFKHFNEDIEQITQQPDTMLFSDKEEEYINSLKQESKKLKISTNHNTTSTSLEEAKYVKTNFDVSTSRPKESAEIYTMPPHHTLDNEKEVKTVLKETSSLRKENQYITTITSPLSQKKTMEFALPQANQDISIVSTLTPLLPTQTKQWKDSITTLELSTASGSKEITDIFTRTRSNDDTFNTATPSKALKDSSTTAISTNVDIVAATAATEKQIIDKEFTTITRENDNDRTTENTILLRNENLLLNTTQTMTMATTTPIPTFQLGTLKTNNAIKETATTDDDDEEQQALIETSATALNRNKTVDDIVPDKIVTDNKPQISTSSHSNSNNSVKFKSKQGNQATTSTTPLANTATIYSPTPDDETITTENLLVTMTPFLIQEFKTNEQSVIETEKEMETTVTTISTTPLMKKEERQQKTTMEAIDISQITPKFRDYDETSKTETEKVLKLIDLEKHEDLKKSSLSSIQHQHYDDGHDGFKTIKKKQLIDKHYQEALLNSNNPVVQDDLNIPSLKTSSITYSTSTTTPLTVPYSKPLLLPIKHGFLGPILMEEKTFHVIHHPAGNLNHVKDNKNAHLSPLETQLRHGHFVELKAKAKMDLTTKTIATTSSNIGINYKQETTTVANATDNKDQETPEDLQKFDTDNKDVVPGNKNVKTLTSALGYENEKDFQKSASHLFFTAKTITSNKDNLLGNINNKTLTVNSEIMNKIDLRKSAPETDTTVISTLLNIDDFSRMTNNRSLNNTSEFVNEKDFQVSDTVLNATAMSSTINEYDFSRNQNNKSLNDSLELATRSELQTPAPVINTTVMSTTLNTNNFSGNLNSKYLFDTFEFETKKDLQKSDTVLDTTVGSTNTNKEHFSRNSNYKFSDDSFKFGKENDFINYAPVLDITAKSSTLSQGDLSKYPSSKSLTDSLESGIKKVSQNLAPVLDSTVGSLIIKKEYTSRTKNDKFSADSLETSEQKMLSKFAALKDSSVKSLLPFDDGRQKSSIEYDPQIDFQKSTKIFPHNLHSTIVNTDNKSSTTYVQDSATNSLEFGIHNILLKPAAIIDTTVKSLASNKDEYLNQSQPVKLDANIEAKLLTDPGSARDSDDFKPRSNLHNFATVLPDTTQTFDKFFTENKTPNEDNTAKSDDPNEDEFRTGPGSSTDSVDFKQKNSAKVLTDTARDFIKFNTENTTPNMVTNVKPLTISRDKFLNDLGSSTDSLDYKSQNSAKVLSDTVPDSNKFYTENKAPNMDATVKSDDTHNAEFLTDPVPITDSVGLKSQNTANVLHDTARDFNKFDTENKTPYVDTTVNLYDDNENKFLNGQGSPKGAPDFKPQSHLQNSAQVLSDTVPTSKQIYTEKRNNKEPELLKQVPLVVNKENKLQKSSTVLTTTDTLKSLNSKAMSDLTKTINEASFITPLHALPKEDVEKYPPVLSTTVFHTVHSVATKTPIVQANTMFNLPEQGFQPQSNGVKEKTESKISDIQIEVYDSTIDSIVASTNFKDNNNNPIYSEVINDEALQGKTTKPPVSMVQQERFTQYVIDRTETSTQEPVNYSTIQVASGKPEPAAIEIHINVSESFGNESEDLEFSYPQSEYNNNNNHGRVEEESYDETKVNDNIKLKIPSNTGSNSLNKDSRSDEILVVEVIDTDNTTEQIQSRKSKDADDLFVSENTPPPPPPPPPYQPNFDRDSDTIFYISNTEVKVGESIPTAKNSYEERKLKLESQFFPANYMASTHPNINTAEDSNSPHHLYEEDIILSSNRNQADSLKIYRNRNEPSPPLDVTYVGESIIEVEQSPDSAPTTTYIPDQQQPHIATQQADVIIQPAILPEISIGVPVIGELPPQIELKEIDFMPNEAQLHRSGIYEENDSGNSNNMFNNDIDDNTINAGSTGYNSHDVVDNSNNINNNQRLDESSIQYGGDLIDESADGGFDGVEGSYPFGRPNIAAAAAASMTKTRKQKQNHVADYTHLYVNYGVNNMRKDELSADVKDSGELIAVGGLGGGSSLNANSNEQNITSFKEFLNKISMNNSSFTNGNLTQNERMSNATAFSVFEDINDLENKNTEDIVNLISLAIGLFIVILPVVVTCSMFWALRYLYKKYHSNVTDSSGYSDQTDTKGQMNEDGVEKGEFIHEPPPPTSSSPTNSDKDAIQKFTDTSNKPSTTDSIVKFSTEKSSQLDQISAKHCSSLPSASKTKDSLQLSLALHSSLDIHTVHDDIEMPGPNGSITKMTLENNLLIVETEERNDISRVARETKMDYNKDGVFVVEVARGIDSKSMPESPVTEGSEKMLSMFDTKHNNGILGFKVANEKNCLGNEKVQIHSPPPENSTEEGPRSLHQIEEVEEPINSPHLHDNDGDEDAIMGLAYKSNTGLSQSDLSITSSNDSNKGYCYGNQALYVVDQSGYSTMSPTGIVALKCDSIDIKDEDHNPENDHYLEHSPDKKEDSKDKEDVEETIKKPENSGSKVSEEKSPRQRSSEKEKLQDKFCKDTEEDKYLETVKRIENDNNISKAIEVDSQNKIFNEIVENLAITDLGVVKEIPVLADSTVASLPLAETLNSAEQTPPKQISSKLSLMNEIPILVEPSQIIESSSPLKDKVEPQLPIKSSVFEETHLVEPVIAVTEDTIFAAPDKFSDNVVLENQINSENHMKSVENPVDHITTENLSKDYIIENGVISENLVDNENPISENGLVDTNGITLQLQELQEISSDKPHLNGDDSENANEANGLNGKSAQIDIKPLTNGLDSLPDLVTELNSTTVQNGHIDSEPQCNTSTDMENGYDSIMSLPEPPPTTEEQLNNDLSDQQLDSLPPPPPPEIFNLKDLPPPLTNGTGTDSLPSEDSNNFYNTLPPPPPTTLEVSATNGKMHASPLTPPASPPAHFTNNLHAGLCGQPIAVDVNGS